MRVEFDEELKIAADGCFILNADCESGLNIGMEIGVLCTQARLWAAAAAAPAFDSCF